jgi:hypothetical protein
MAEKSACFFLAFFFEVTRLGRAGGFFFGGIS